MAIEKRRLGFPNEVSIFNGGPNVIGQ